MAPGSLATTKMLMRDSGALTGATSRYCSAVSSAMVHSRRDRIRRCERIVMFPDDDHLPTGCLQTGRGLGVASDVRGEFLVPVIDVLAGPTAVVWTSVPEASMDEDRDPSPSEYDIRSPSRTADRGEVDSITETTSMKLRAQSELWSGVTTPIRDHRRAHRWCRRPGHRLLIHPSNQTMSEPVKSARQPSEVPS